jgi:hypothetical protein
MIKIKIAEDERSLNEVDAQWINQQINRRKEEGLSVCVRITIKNRNIDMVLSTPNCIIEGAIARSPNPQEKEIINLWNERGLDKQGFTSGNLIAFISQLQRFF